jgi:hypothetical protein
MSLLAVIVGALIVGALTFALVDTFPGEGFALPLVALAVIFTAFALGLGLR